MGQVLILVGCGDNKKEKDHKVRSSSEYPRQHTTEELVSTFKSDTIVSYRTKKSIPLFISNFLNGIREDGFSIADQDEQWNATDAKVGDLPDKKLMLFGLGHKTAILSFVQGGFLSSKHLYLIQYAKDQVTDYWYVIPPFEITTKEQALSYLLSLTIQK